MVEKEAKVYSHSRLWLFENCPEYYKAKYIDKSLPELPKSGELFLGSVVHDSLEWLYKNIKSQSIELDNLLRYYSVRWSEEAIQEIRFSKGSQELYFNKGIKFLLDYYMRNKPFSENTISTEKRVLFPLDESGKYSIQGYIDRVVLNEDGVYEVHDYKTNDFPKNQEQIDKDRQLAFYHLGLREMLGKEIKVKLVWHFLSHGIKMKSERTEEQLEKLKKNTLELIKKIENTNHWPACGKKWCDWCEYKRQACVSSQ